MGRLLTAANPPTTQMQRTVLASASSASASSITVDNTEGFSVDDFIIIGEEGKEDAELIKVTSVTAPNTIGISGTTSFAHSVDDPVTGIMADKVRFYGTTSTTITSAHLLATVDISVDSRSKETLYHHVAGSSSYYYKYTFYNSATGDENALADAVTISGGTDNDIYCTEEDVYDFLHMSKDDEAAPSPSVILALIEARTLKMNHDTNSSFRTETVTSTDLKYVDGRGKYEKWYYLGYAPVITLTSLEVTMTVPGSTASWTTLTSGRDNDYILDKANGMVYVISDETYPDEYPDSLRWYGTWGRSSVPNDVRDAVIKGVVMDLARSNLYKAMLTGHSFDISNVTIEQFKQDWKELVSRYRIYRFINV